MAGGLLRLEVDAEAGVALGLDVVGHVAAVDGDDDLQVAGAGLAGVNCDRRSPRQVIRLEIRATTS